MKLDVAPVPELDQTAIPLRYSTSGSTLNRTYARTAVFPTTDGTAPAGDQPRYGDVKALGQGGMGEVTLVEDHDIRRKVAIKRLLGEHTSEEAVLRFAEEVRTVGQLEHPSIPPVHDVGTDEQGRPYFTMKYVQGETLEQVIEHIASGDPEYVQRYTVECRLQIFQKILEAISFAHSNGVIHRDIKPSNVMVGPFGTVTVMDWGLAKRIAPDAASGRSQAAGAGSTSEGPVAADGRDTRLLMTQQGALLGTPAYMSPEQARGENQALDERSDVYSLAVMLLEFLSSRHYLADKKTLEDLLKGILEFDPESGVEPLLVKAKLGFTFCGPIKKAMALNPADRFQTVADFNEALAAVLRGDMPVVCPFTFQRRVSFAWMRWAENHPGMHIASLGLVALSVVGGLGSAVYHLVR
jgi:serine/threonine-protein kinase